MSILETLVSFGLKTAAVASVGKAKDLILRQDKQLSFFDRDTMDDFFVRVSIFAQMLIARELGKSSVDEEVINLWWSDLDILKHHLRRIALEVTSSNEERVRFLAAGVAALRKPGTEPGGKDIEYRLARILETIFPADIDLLERVRGLLRSAETERDSLIYLGEQKSYFWIAPADKVAIRRISVFDGGDRVEVALLGKGEGTLDRTIALDSLVEFSNLVQVGLLRTAGVTEGDDSDDFFIVSPYVITPLGLELLRRFESLCDAVRNVKAPEGV